MVRNNLKSRSMRSIFQAFTQKESSAMDAASALAALSGFAIGGLIKARFGQPRPYLIEPPDPLHRVGA
jgi:hypothetical protein